jgi:outer membrane receptor for ferrienterochelin and colicin
MNLRILTALAITCIGMQVFAQDEHATVPESQTRIRFEDESVQWIPYSVSVLTKSELESTYRRDLEHIESMVPGLIIDRMNRHLEGPRSQFEASGLLDHQKHSTLLSLSISTVSMSARTQTGYRCCLISKPLRS